MGIKQFILELQIILPHKLMYSLHQLLLIPLKKFKQNKKFTIGEWVYSQYVDGFKRGNLYYRPVYDKGYNFSRRYIPGSNISSFASPGPTQIIQNNNTQLPLSGDNESEFNTFDQLPIID